MLNEGETELARNRLIRAFDAFRRRTGLPIKFSAVSRTELHYMAVGAITFSRHVLERGDPDNFSALLDTLERAAEPEPKP